MTFSEKMERAKAQIDTDLKEVYHFQPFLASKLQKGPERAKQNFFPKNSVEVSNFMPSSNRLKKISKSISQEL